MNFRSTVLVFVPVPKIYSSRVQYQKFGINVGTELPFTQSYGSLVSINKQIGVISTNDRDSMMNCLKP